MERPSTILDSPDELQAGKSTRPIPERAAEVVSAAAAALGVAALLGWITGWRLLASFGDDYIPMAPSTAVCFLLLSGALFLHVRRSQNRVAQRAAVIAALLPLLVACANLIQLSTGLKIGIDWLFVHSPDNLGGFPLGRMSPLTAVNFLLTAVAVLSLTGVCLDPRKPGKLAGVFGFIVLSVAAVIAMGYLYRAPLLYGGSVIPQALTTALAFLGLGVGLVSAAGPQAWPLRSLAGTSTRARLLRVFLPFTLAMVVLHDFLESLFISVDPEEALLTALTALASLVVVSFIVSYLARSVGRALDRAEAEGKQAAAALKQQLSRTALLNQIARAIAERQDILSILRVTLADLEDHLPVDAAVAFLYDKGAEVLTVSVQGPKGRLFVAEMGMVEGAVIPVETMGLRPCLRGETVCLSDLSRCTVPSPMVQHGMQSGVATPLAVGGNVLGVLGVLRHEADSFSEGEIEFLRQMAEQVALATQQAQLYQDLQKAYEDLRHSQHATLQQERLRALGQMASGIAHDFNNALSPIMGFSELMLAHPAMLEDTEGVKRNLELIFTGAQDAAKVVSRLREFYRKREEGEIFLPLDLNAVVTQSISLTQPKWKDQALAHGLSVAVESDLQKVPIISGNESELREALTNLIFNAVDAIGQKAQLSGQEEGTISLRTYGCMGERVYGSTSESPTHPHNDTPTHVFLEVSDTGIGMDEDTRLHCLDPFYTTKGEHGTGMGLSMVFGIVTRHEGTIEVESEPDKGTTFILRLPVLERREAPRAPREETRPVRPLRVLVVDDEPVVRNVLTQILRRDGHTVEAAVNGRGALETFRSGKFDLVITDRAMPEMNGDQLAYAIKQIAPEVPVIMLTGFGDIMHASGVKPAGVDHLLGKPIDVTKMRKALADLMANVPPEPA